MRPLRLVVVLLFTSVGISLIFAALTLLFRHDVLAYQQARDPSAAPGALARTLWTRPIPILVVAVAYVFVARRLLNGGHSAYRRVRIVSALGLVAVAYLLLSATYPGWLQIVQVVQLAVLLALVIAVNRRSVRAVFAGPPAADPRPRNRRAAWLLIALAPMIAELSIGNVPLREAWFTPIYLPIYGAGALFAREVVRRTGGGVLNLVLIGVVYGLVEEGLALQSLTSTHLYDAAGWAPRLFGFNTAYAELNLVYHAVFSITVPVLIVELLFGTGPYVRRGGLIWTGVVAVLGAALLRLLVPPSQDPGYQMPWPAILFVASLAAVVAVVALRLRVPSRRAWTPPSPAVVAVLPAVSALAFLSCIWPFGSATQPLFTHGAWALLPMTAAALIVAGTWVALRRWSAAAAWTPRHVWTACFGAVAGHTVFGLFANATTVEDRLFLAVLAALSMLLAARPPRIVREPGGLRADVLFSAP